MTSGVKFFEQSHIKDVVAQIKFIANPRDSVSFARFANFLPKVGGKTAMKIYSSALEISKKSLKALSEFFFCSSGVLCGSMTSPSLSNSGL